MKITFFEIEDWMPEHIQSQLPDHELQFVKDPLTKENASEFTDTDIVSVFIFSKVSREVIESLPNLKLIAARSTGYDHIDLDAAKEKDITVTNVPKYGSVTVAEHAWALILSLSRKLFQSYDRTERGQFSTLGLRGFDLEHKTLGLIGLGEIGKNVARMSRGFNMKLRIYNRHIDPDFAAEFDNCVFVEHVNDIFTHADVISFHVPLTPETYHMLNMDNYHLLKRGSVIVNTARGAIIETKALIKALQDNIIAGAGLDVLESEGTIKEGKDIDPDHLPNEMELRETVMNHILIDMDNVIITPHNAFNSDESVRRLIDQDVQNINSFILGETDQIDAVS